MEKVGGHLSHVHCIQRVGTGDGWVRRGCTGYWWPGCASLQAPSWESTPFTSIGGLELLSFRVLLPELTQQKAVGALLGPLGMWGLFWLPGI